MRPNQVFVRPLRPTDECGGNLMLSGANKYRLSFRGRGTSSVCGDASWIRVVKKERHSFAIDRYVDIVDRSIAAPHKCHRKDVLSICGKDMVDDHSATCSVRRALDVVPWMLRDVLRIRVC